MPTESQPVVVPWKSWCHLCEAIGCPAESTVDDFVDRVFALQLKHVMEAHDLETARAQQKTKP